MLYAINRKSGSNLSLATCKSLVPDAVLWAKDNGFEWIEEAEAVALGLQVRNRRNGMLEKVQTAREYIIPVRIHEKAIQCYWLQKWYGVRYYMQRGTARPGKKVMAEAERTFRINSGMPDNFTITFDWK